MLCVFFSLDVFLLSCIGKVVKRKSDISHCSSNALLQNKDKKCVNVAVPGGIDTNGTGKLVAADGIVLQKPSVDVIDGKNKCVDGAVDGANVTAGSDNEVAVAVASHVKPVGTAGSIVQKLSVDVIDSKIKHVDGVNVTAGMDNGVAVAVAPHVKPVGTASPIVQRLSVDVIDGKKSVSMVEMLLLRWTTGLL
jgi:hypothetical protein